MEQMFRFNVSFNGILFKNLFVYGTDLCLSELESQNDLEQSAMGRTTHSVVEFTSVYRV
jgi:hypothetical protein